MRVLTTSFTKPQIVNQYKVISVNEGQGFQKYFSCHSQYISRSWRPFRTGLIFDKQDHQAQEITTAHNAVKL